MFASAVVVSVQEGDEEQTHRGCSLTGVDIAGNLATALDFHPHALAVVAETADLLSADVSYCGFDENLARAEQQFLKSARRYTREWEKFDDRFRRSLESVSVSEEDKGW